MGKVLKISFFSILIPLWLGILFVLWFVPWIFVLHSGFLIYFPYEGDGHGRYLRVAGPVSSLWSEEWVSPEEIPRSCKAAIVASEDANFYQHYGIDLQSIRENLEVNERAQKIKRGGSTITQQLVKNAFLSRERSYLRKGREILGAVLLDLTLSKELQQTWYLNIIEFGPEVYGIQQAAHFYFNVSAKKLTPSQCVALATIIPSPRKWNKTLKNKTFTSFFIRRYYRILGRMRQMNLDTPRNLAQARSLGLWSGTSKVAKRNQDS